MLTFVNPPPPPTDRNVATDRMPSPDSIRDPNEVPSAYFPIAGSQGIKFEIVVPILLLYVAFTYVLMFWPRRSMSKLYETLVKLTGN
jgi:hypothetical protein